MHVSKNCKQPMKEEFLLDGKFEPTNEPYALAKMHGIKMCESYNYQYKTNYISLIPASLYGQMIIIKKESHVIPSLMTKFYLAKKTRLIKLKFGAQENLKGNFCMFTILQIL